MNYDSLFLLNRDNNVEESNAFFLF